MILILFLKPNFIINNSKYIYGLNVVLLILVLFFGNKVNGSRAWFNFGVFSFQPSEFMKLSLILYLTYVISNSQLKSKKDHWVLILKIFIIFFVPSFLTFLEPDTGAVIIYFFITLSIVLFSKISKKNILILAIIGTLFILGIICLYIFKNEVFFNIFGSDIYYRIERLSSFSSGKGMQIENALTSIGSASFFTWPTNAHNLYFPEATTDFIFTLNINNFGILGAIIILACYFILDIAIIYYIFNTHNKRSQILTIGFLGMFIYQQIQNIFMNLGLLPIIGIPLPFLSYGGSSLILFFCSFAFIFKLKLENEKYPYRVFYR